MIGYIFLGFQLLDWKFILFFRMFNMPRIFLVSAKERSCMCSNFMFDIWVQKLNGPANDLHIQDYLYLHFDKSLEIFHCIFLVLVIYENMVYSRWHRSSCKIIQVEQHCLACTKMDVFALKPGEGWVWLGYS